MTEEEIAAAVQDFWGQRTIGTLAGSHPQAFLNLIANDLRKAGWSDVVQAGTRLVVGGHFRPSKAWDIVCWEGSTPRIAVEFKSQVGSYGNNENNRYEEALGNALDLRARYGKEIGLGFVFVICDEPGSRSKTRERIPDADPIFRESSHIDRRLIFARRIVDFLLHDVPLYDAAAVLMTSRDGKYLHPEEGRMSLLNLVGLLSDGRNPV